MERKNFTPSPRTQKRPAPGAAAPGAHGARRSRSKPLSPAGSNLRRRVPLRSTKLAGRRQPPAAARASNWCFGRRWDSSAEGRRFAELKKLEEAGQIFALECQKSFELRVAGLLIGHYKADFTYTRRLEIKGCEPVLEIVVEDTKGRSHGLADQAQLMKHRLMRACHGIRVREVRS